MNLLFCKNWKRKVQADKFHSTKKMYSLSEEGKSNVSFMKYLLVERDYQNVESNCGKNCKENIWQKDPNRNYRTLIVVPSVSCKTYFKRQNLTKIINREKFYGKRSPGQYSESNFENNIRESMEDEGSIVILDDLLKSNRKAVDPIFTRGRHKNSDVYFSSQPYFDLPWRKIGNNRNIIFFSLSKL